MTVQPSSTGSATAWQARPPHSDWRLIAPEHVEDYRAKDWEVRPVPALAQAAPEPAQTAMTAHDALNIAANIAEAVDSGRGNEKQIAKAIRDVAKTGYWEITKPLVGATQPTQGGDQGEAVAPGIEPWNPADFWEYVGALAGEFEADQMRDTLSERGLRIVGITDPAYESASRGDLTKIAAECHRAKWEFDLCEDFQPSKASARNLITSAFNALHRIGDMALKLRDASSVSSTHDGSAAK